MEIEAIDGRRRQRLRRLVADRSGSTYALLAAALIPMLGFAGIGIDVSRTYMAQSRLQSAVDAAVLAAVRAEQVSPGTGTNPGSRTISTVNSFMGANYTPCFMGSTNGTPVVTVARAG